MSISVTNRFQASQYLQKLSNDFKTVKVNVEALQAQVLRRLCRDIEKQFGKQQANLNYDTEDYVEYLKELLDEQLFDTKDILKGIVVLGNKKGMLTGRIFNKADYTKDLIDHKQFDDKYPIFIDTSVVKYLDEGEKDYKREREQTFSFAPDEKKQIIDSSDTVQTQRQTITDLQTAWAEQESDLNAKIEEWKRKYYSAAENNENLIKVASENEQSLMNKVNELNEFNQRATARVNELTEFNQKATETVNALQSQMNQMEVSSIEEEIQEESENKELNELQQVNALLQEKIDEMQRNQSRNSDRPKVMGLWDDLTMAYDEELNDERASRADIQIAQTDEKLNVLKTKLTLSHFGLTSWNPNTTSFLDYLMSFRQTLATYDATEKQGIKLLLSALPSSYSFVRVATLTHPEYEKDDYGKTEQIMVRLIVGSKEKIFSEFMSLQKKKNENFVQYYQKLYDFLLFAYDLASEKRSSFDKDQTAYRMIKEKMVKSFPNQFVPEFKRRLENKENLPDIFMTVLDMRDQFPDMKNIENDNSGENLFVMRQKRDDWEKHVKCFKCGQKGHIKKNCYKREAKTKKSGSKWNKEKRD